MDYFDKYVRRELEVGLIGSVLLSPFTYKLIGDIISPINFKNRTTKELWTCIAECHEHAPIDLITVIRHILKKHNNSDEAQNLIMHMHRCAAVVNSSAHAQYWAFMLLEADISEKFIAFITNAKLDTHTDTVLYAAVQEVVLELNDQQNDVLKIIDQAADYFNQIAPGHKFVTSFADLKENVSTKAKRLKKMGVLSGFVNELLSAHHHWPLARQRKIKALTDQLIKELIHE
jgi:replicative DNA helicase